jgi:glycosyltransferase involved in cell wall biosynthesis
MQRILIVVRWPVGGIRTYLKYFYPHVQRAVPDLDVGLVVPRVEEVAALEKDLAGLRVKFIYLDEHCSLKTLMQGVDRELRARRYDLIHSHGLTAAVAASVIAKLRRVPHLTTVHDVLQISQFQGIKGAAYRLGLQLALRMVDVIQVVGNDARDNLLTFLGGGLAKRMSVVRNGIVPAPFLAAVPRDLRAELGLSRDVFLIGFFGRFMAQKGFKYLVEALRQRELRVAGGEHAFHVVAFGSGGFIREEAAQIKRVGLTHRFSFLPFSPEVGGALKSVDVVAIPSLWEAMPLLPMEAMVAGVPVIGTSCIGLGEILADTPAAIVPPGDAAALAAALEREERSSSRSAAQGFSATAARRFDVEHSVPALVDLMRRVASRSFITQS